MTRIIGGTARGRRLRTPRGEATRPTSDRVREALFSTLEAQLGPLTGLRLLDLYAGSGAVGLEGVSRGAAVLTTVEADRRTARIVQENAVTLDFSQVEVLARKVGRVLAQHPSAPYDVVFLDPPYALANAEVEEVLVQLVAQRWLATGAVVVVERSARDPEPTWPHGLVREREKEYGETVLWYVRADLQDPDDR